MVDGIIRLGAPLRPPTVNGDMNGTVADTNIVHWRQEQHPLVFHQIHRRGRTKTLAATQVPNDKGIETPAPQPQNNNKSQTTITIMTKVKTKRKKKSPCCCCHQAPLLRAAAATKLLQDKLLPLQSPMFIANNISQTLLALLRPRSTILLFWWTNTTTKSNNATTQK